MVRIISLVHIDRDEAVFCTGEFDYLISFGDVEAHRFLRNNVRARFEPGENDLGMQMVGSCNSHHIQIRNFSNDLQPRSFAEKDLWRVAGPITKVLLRSFRRVFGACGDRCQFEPDPGKISRPLIQSNPA